MFCPVRGNVRVSLLQVNCLTHESRPKRNVVDRESNATSSFKTALQGDARVFHGDIKELLQRRACLLPDCLTISARDLESDLENGLPFEDAAAGLTGDAMLVSTDRTLLHT